MFICATDWKKRTPDTFWWDIALHSRGPCEACGKTAVCADIHHAKIPPARNDPNKESGGAA